MQLAFGVLTAFASVALLGLMAMTCIDVAGRYFFRSPLPAAYELTTLLMAILIFAGLPVVTGVGAHLKVDLLEGVTKRFAPTPDCHRHGQWGRAARRADLADRRPRASKASL